jgi:hypothetical protein
VDLPLMQGHLIITKEPLLTVGLSILDGPHPFGGTSPLYDGSSPLVGRLTLLEELFLLCWVFLLWSDISHFWRKVSS